jgi:hypothetical protein
MRENVVTLFDGERAKQEVAYFISIRQTRHGLSYEISGVQQDPRSCKSVAKALTAIADQLRCNAPT